jgi:antirestriction protein ArdC
MKRKIEPGPIHTFKGWQRLNRFVRKGEKAISLCMPVTWKQNVDPAKYLEPGESPADHQQVVIRRRFVFRPNWFLLCQTDGQPLEPVSIPQWDQSRALASLKIELIPFDLMNGNVQGFARGQQVAVSAIAHLPHRTLIHEIAHVVLGHTAETIEGMIDGEELTPRDVREVEAEAVTYLVTQLLGLPGEAFSRGYLQHWLHGNKIEERSVHKIFHAAEAILKAGREDKTFTKPVNPSESDSPESAD